MVLDERVVVGLYSTGTPDFVTILLRNHIVTGFFLPHGQKAVTLQSKINQFM